MMKNTGNVAGTSSQGHSPWREAWTVSGRERERERQCDFMDSLLFNHRGFY